MSQPTAYLVTGANRGIGLAMVTALAARPNVVVFAGARDPARATDLNALAKAHPNRVHVLKIISADRESNKAAIEEVKRVAGRLDIVIANAGINNSYDPALEVSVKEMVEHFEINTNGPLVLFQEAYPLLKESKTRKFVTVTSGIGSITIAAQLPVNVYPYGASKAALNWVTRKLHHDFPDFVIFPISPGTVETDMAKLSREKDPAMVALQKAFPAITPEESARGILENVDNSTRETHGGQFVDYSGLGKWGW
ncbi:NAD(P)-binding protein [Schizophyllum commune H4-8]|nr:NAD(P)-binding protein [Schizophyllum commune H4-8]KAI5892431.1 NAD(P)-binding protein [Schizophyllum commune H4-8]